jgi:hypothetical protein
METQNVSAQIYFKQLPLDPNAGRYGCDNTNNILSTCVNDIDTDAQIENAFQSQFGLSEYYKTPGVFNAIKRDYMDQTLGNLEYGQNVNQQVNKLQNVMNEKYPVNRPDAMSQESQATKNIKSNFGSSKSNFGFGGLSMMYIILIIAVLAYFYLKK